MYQENYQLSANITVHHDVIVNITLTKLMQHHVNIPICKLDHNYLQCSLIDYQYSHKHIFFAARLSPVFN